MTDEELKRLIHAIESKNYKLFTGDIEEETIEALKELRDLREWVQEIPIVL